MAEAEEWVRRSGSGGKKESGEGVRGRERDGKGEKESARENDMERKRAAEGRRRERESAQRWRGWGRRGCHGSWPARWLEVDEREKEGK